MTTVEVTAANATHFAAVSATRAPDARHAAILDISGLRQGPVAPLSGAELDDLGAFTPAGGRLRHPRISGDLLPHRDAGFSRFLILRSVTHPNDG
ncbi:MAG: hypothetical protein ACR2MP_13555 [Streptosporangiaceae bacterium]